MNDASEKLLAIAARLITDVPLSAYPEDNPKTTPKSILEQHYWQERKLQRLACELRQIASEVKP